MGCGVVVFMFVLGRERGGFGLLRSVEDVLETELALVIAVWWWGGRQAGVAGRCGSFG